MSDMEDKKEKLNTPTPLAKWCKNVKAKYDDIWWLVNVVTVIVGIFVGIAVTNLVILLPKINEIQKDSVESAKKAVLSQDTLNDIASHLRPYGVVNAYLNDSSATFEYDEGIGNVVESVDFHDGETNLSAILTFRMKHFVRLPLVRPLTPGIYIHSFWQTNKFDWAFEVRPSVTTERFQGVDTSTIEQGLSGQNYRFFVELVTK